MLQEDITRILNSDLGREIRNHPMFKDYKVVKDGTENGFRALYIFFDNGLSYEEANSFFVKGCKINQNGTLDSRFFIKGYFNILVFS